MDVELPDGTTLQDIPEGTTKGQIASRLQKAGHDVPEGWFPKNEPSIGRAAGLTARAALSGASQIPAMVGDFANAAIEKAFSTPQHPINLGRPSKSIEQGLNALGLPQPETGTERVVQDISSALAGGGTLAGGAGALSRIAVPAARNALSSLAANPAGQAAAIATGSGAESGAREFGAGPDQQFAAGLAGTLLPSAAARATGVAMRPAKSYATPTETLNAQRAEDMGFTLTAGQKTRNERLLSMESTLKKAPGGGDFQKIQVANQENVNSRALSSIGESGNAVTPEVLSNASARIGDEFTRIVGSNEVFLNEDFFRDLARVEQKHVKVWNKSDQVTGILDRALQDAVKGKLTGEEYQNIRGALQRDSVAKIRAGDSNTGHALADLAEALDNAAERSVSRQDLVDLKQARKEWRNLLVLEDATASGASRAGAGNIDPDKLANALIRNRGKRQFAKTPFGSGDDLSDLARVSTSVKDLVPSSGTTERLYWLHLLSGAMGSVLGGPVSGTAAGLMAPYAATKTMLTGPVQNYLTQGIAPSTQNILSGQRTPKNALVNLLLNNP